MKIKKKEIRDILNSNMNFKKNPNFASDQTDIVGIHMVLFKAHTTIETSLPAFCHFKLKFEIITARSGWSC